jgi:hypothetical protein
MKKKGKVVKTFEDRKLYFYLCPRSSVLSRGGYIRWVGEVQIVEKLLSIQVARKNGHIQSPDRDPETFVGHVRATQNSSVHRIYPGLLLGSSKYYQTCPVITFFAVSKSFCRTYPTGQPGYSNYF